MINQKQLFMCSRCFKKQCRTPTGIKGTNFSYEYIFEDGVKFYGNVCPPCKRKRVREEWNSENSKKKLIIKKYEKTFEGYLMRKYRNMLSRIQGVQKRKSHLYKNKQILSKEDFYRWALSHPDYERLYIEYKESGFERKLAPTVDRIDPSIGYIITNMRWLTHSENSRNGAKNRKKKGSPT